MLRMKDFCLAERSVVVFFRFKQKKVPAKQKRGTLCVSHKAELS